MLLAKLVLLVLLVLLGLLVLSSAAEALGVVGAVGAAGAVIVIASNAGAYAVASFVENSTHKYDNDEDNADENDSRQEHTSCNQQWQFFTGHGIGP